MKKIYIFFLFMKFFPALQGQNEIVDTTFGSKGFVTTPFAFFSIAECCLTAPGDSIILAGMAGINQYHNHSFALSRHLPDGTPDSTFGNQGRVVSKYINYQPNDAITALAVQPNGDILAGGYINNLFGITRYHPDGNLDLNFGIDGFVTTYFTLPNEDNQLYSMAIQPDGKIVAVGVARNLLSMTSVAALVRYNADGTLDPTFGVDGKVISDYDGMQGSGALAITILPDGKILVAGFDHGHTVLAGYLTDGTLEWVKQVAGIGTLTTMLCSNDKVTLVGWENDRIQMTRLFTDGTMDYTFGNNGVQISEFSGKWSSYLETACLAEDGKIFATGNRLIRNSNGFTWDVVLYCFNPDGTPDLNFGTNGAAIVTVDGKYFWSRSVNDQSSGKIIIAGYSGLSYADYNFTMVRCLRKLVLSLSDLDEKDTYLFYPNPVKREASLEYTLKMEEDLSIKLIDMQGKVLVTFISNERQSAGEHKELITFPGDLVGGYYLLRVQTKTGSALIKLLKD